MRGSPFIDLIKRLQLEGIALCIFDPDVLPEKLTNINREILRNCFGNYVPLKAMAMGDLSSTLVGCDGVVVCKDLLNASSVQQLKNAGIPIYNLGYFSFKSEGL